MVTGCVSISDFTSSGGLPVGITSFTVGLEICAGIKIAAGIKKYKSLKGIRI